MKVEVVSKQNAGQNETQKFNLRPTFRTATITLSWVNFIRDLFGVVARNER